MKITPTSTSQSFKSVCCWAILSSIFLVLSACGAETKEFRNPPPHAWFPEKFRDIPLPPFYEARQESDQLAVSYANGAIRHFDVTMQQVQKDRGDSGRTLLDWYNSQLRSQGWLPVKDPRLPSTKRQYTKDSDPKAHNSQKTELLELRTGRAKKHNIIRIRLVR